MDGNGCAVLEDRLKVACDIVCGRAAADPSEEGKVITGAKKDLNAKGKGPEWYRMVWRSGCWQYVSSDRLPSGNFRASDRRASVSGPVYTGEIVAGHDRGGQIDIAWVICPPDADGKVMVSIEFKKRRDGQLEFSLPSGDKILTPNPRAK